MREDMFEVIIERPRRGGSWKRDKPLPRPDEESIKSQPMGRGRGSKTLNENLAPLKRFLRRQVGRPWDRVYAEICAEISVKSAVQKHVRDHLKDMVRLDLEWDGDKLVSHTWYAFPWRWGETLYVDPRTRILRVTRFRRPPKEKRAVLREIEAGIVALSLSGAWFAVTLQTLTEPAYDVVEKRFVTSADWQALTNRYGRPGVFAAGKRQLNRKEIRALALT